MSRIGKKKITIPPGVLIDIQNNVVLVRGPKGELKQKIHPRVTVAVDKDEVSLRVANEHEKHDRALWGTFASLISNMVSGVTAGFKKQLEINGVGFKAGTKGEVLVLEVGFSHPIEIKPKAGIKFVVEKNVITIEGADKQLVGEAAAQIRNIRKPEPYKGKGIKYVDELVRRKAGKTAAKGTAA